MSTRQKLMMPLLLALFAASANAGPVVYAISVNYNNFTSQFGTMDLTAGTFHNVGGVIPDGLAGLMAGPNGKLLSLSFSGNLDSVDPTTGAISIIGATGLGNVAGVTAEFEGTVYATDLYNNLYTLNTTTGAASLIGSTGLPICPSLISPVEVSDEALFTANGNLYVSFDGVNLADSTLVDSPALYQLNPTTGVATLLGPTALGLQAVSQLNGTVYGFDFDPAGQNSLLSLNVADGSSIFLNNYASPTVPGGLNTLAITGVAPTPEPASFVLAGIGVATLVVYGMRRRTRNGVHRLRTIRLGEVSLS